MRERNLSRHDVGREIFLSEVSAWFLKHNLFNNGILTLKVYCYIDRYCLNTYVGFGAKICFPFLVSVH